MVGLNIFLYSLQIAASKFVCTLTDGVSFIDGDDSTKMIWHCSNLRKADMLAKTVASVYIQMTEGDY